MGTTYPTNYKLCVFEEGELLRCACPQMCLSRQLGNESQRTDAGNQMLPTFPTAAQKIMSQAIILQLFN